MRGRDLNRSIKIFIDNTDAMQKSEDLKAKIAELRAEMVKLEAEGKKESRQYLNTEKSLRKHELTQSKYLNTIKDTQRVLKNLSGATYNELNAARRVVYKELLKEQRGTEEYTRKLKLYQQVQKEITVARKEMSVQVGKDATLFQKMTGSFNKYFGIVSTFAASITGASLAFRKLSQDAAKMSDVYDGVSKTTGFTREQVASLNEEFKKMDTRVSREELNQFAADAGKLGKETEEDILGFVKAAVRIRIGIGKDLGDDALTDIAKMTDIFVHSTKEMQAMNLEERMIATGSAVRYLAKASTAAEPPIVNFASRMTGIASQANISMQNILGFGSALDQLKQPTEMAATAMQKMIMKMFTDTSTYANIAGMSVQDFTHLLTTDTNTAIKTVLRSLNEQGGFQQLAPIFEDMGLSGARAVGVLSALAANIDMVDKAQADANKSFAEAKTLDEEYNIMNKNAQANLEKRRQAFKDAAEELGNRLNPALLKSTNILTYIVKFLPDVLDFLMKYGRFIFYLVTAYAAYTAGVKANLLWRTKLQALSLKELLIYAKSEIALKRKAAAQHIARVATLAYAASQALLTGNITKLRQAWRLLTATMATNPMGLLMVGATAAVTGIIKLVSWLNRTNTATRALKESTKQYSEEIVRETRESQELFEAFKRTNKETATHNQLKDEIMSRYGQYLQHLVDEEGNITDIGAAITAVNTGLSEQIALKIRNAAVDEIGSANLGDQLKATDKVMDRISKQVSSDVVQSSIRQIINTTLAAFNSGEVKDYAKLQRDLLAEIQQTFDVDAYKGVRNVKNAVADLVDEIKKGDTAIDEVNQLFAGLISNQINVSGVVTDLQAEIDDTKESDIEGDKDLYKEKLAALDHYIAQERERIMRSYMSGEISYEQYLFHLEQLERESLERKLDIYQYDVVRQQEVTNQLLEMKLKMLRMLEDSERKHMDKIIDMQKKTEQARRDSNYEMLKDIARQNAEEWEKRKRAEYESIADMAELAFEFSNELGTMLGAAAMSNEDLVSSSLKNILNLALDALKVQVQISIAGATAQALAQPDSVATFGVAGFARAAILVGMIEAAFAAVKGVVSSFGGGGSSSSYTSSGDSTTSNRRVVDQRALGNYDVIGAMDGRSYSVPYAGVARTGVVPNPVLVGEYGDELIVSAPDFARLQRHVNYPLVLSAIQDSRVPQRAQGNYSTLPSPSGSTDSATVQYEKMLTELLQLLRIINSKGVKANINFREFELAQSRLGIDRYDSSRQ